MRIQPTTTAALAAAALFVLACGPTDDPGIDTERAEKINALVADAGRLPFADPATDLGEPSAPYDTGDYQCVTREATTTKAYDEVVAYAANSTALWPGAIVRGDSVYTGTFIPLIHPRTPLTISVSLENLNGAPSATMESPSLSNYRDTLNGILSSEVDGSTAANIYSEIELVHSEEQMAIALGAGLSWPGKIAEISASFNFSDTTVKSRQIVRFTQAYYTVDIDQPASAADFFAEDVTVDDLAGDIAADNPPVYVSSVTYGRMVIFTMESDYSAEEMRSALEFAYRGGVPVSGEVSLTYQEMLENTNITAYILGGSGNDAAQAINGFDNLMAFIAQGGDYSKDSPGAAIAYKLAYLDDNAPARLSFTSEYEQEECERVSQQVRVVLNNIRVDNAGGDAGGALDVYGTVAVTGTETVTLMDKPSGEDVSIPTGQSWPMMGTIAEAIVDVRPQGGEVISFDVNLVDNDGTFNPDDTICDMVHTAPFESGWRRDVTVLCTGAGAEVSVNFSLSPI